MIEAQSVRTLFRKTYNTEPRLFSAPGRVNLIGEHTDYNQGFVLPVAIDRNTVIAGSARKDKTVRVYSQAFDDNAEFNLDDSKSLKKGRWLTYIAGMARALKEKGYDLCGADLLIASDVPVGAGLSSSAALEIATGFALLSLAEIDIDKVSLAFTSQYVEHNFVGINSGIMDQLTATLGKREHALLIDCRSLYVKYIPLKNDETVFVVCDSRVKHELASSEYNTRRAECEKGVELLREKLPHIKSLRDVSVAEFKSYESILPDTIKRRCRHIITENERTITTAENLQEGNVSAFGQAMFQSHYSLRDDYEVSCNELDLLVEIAESIEGIIGARMTGGGFGGCTVNLLRRDAIDVFQETIKHNYKIAMGYEPSLYIIKSCDGASEI